MSYDSATPLLDIYTVKAIIQKDTCAPIFIPALFSMAKTWKQPKGPWQMNGWRRCDIYIHRSILVITKTEIMPFITRRMDREIMDLDIVDFDSMPL